jgi:hypothetical protein
VYRIVERKSSMHERSPMHAFQRKNVFKEEQYSRGNLTQAAFFCFLAFALSRQFSQA